MGRYLVFLSYIGTGFSGLQLQSGKPLKTVVSILQKALAQLRPAGIPQVTTSSRTDRGVHALCNAVHVDIKRGEHGEEFEPDHISSVLNESFLDFEEDVRVLKTLRVRDNFHSRYLAQQRTYVYRICLPRQVRQPPLTRAVHFPPFEYHRSFLIRQPLDIDLVREAAAILRGTHDFKAFTTPSVLISQPPRYPTTRCVDVDVQPGSGLLSNFSSSLVDQFDYWDLVFRSRCFLYRQIRKMTGVMLAAGRRDISLDDVRQLIEDPDKGIPRKTSIYDVPPYGLYLTDIEYLEKDLIFDSSAASETSEQETLITTTDLKPAGSCQLNNTDSELNNSVGSNNSALHKQHS